MDRRRFIKQTSLSATALALAPYFLASCKKETLFDGKKFSGKVIIVGAGISGMYAAYLLHQQGVDVQVLEASPRYGGRILSNTTFGGFPIELGAEEVHGDRTIWHDIVLANDSEFVTAELNNLYYFNGSIKNEIQASENTFFNDMLEVVNGIKDYTGGDINAESYGTASGVSANVKHIFNALIGNEQGTSNSRIGMHGLREMEEQWTAGDENYMIKNKSFGQIIEDQFSSIVAKIQLNTPINSIDYIGARTILTDVAGNQYEADKVIVTVPLKMLQTGSIAFSPALPNDRLEAFQKIGMDRGIKIILKFDERVWPENTGSIFGNGFVPEYWATGAGGKSDADNVLTAFVMGEKAEQLAALGENIIPELLGELDNILGDVSTHYVDHLIQDWGNEAFIGGAYSYPKPGTGNAREIISKPIAGKIHFAGEATHTGGHFATVHGAIETGLRAVTEIFES